MLAEMPGPFKPAATNVTWYPDAHRLRWTASRRFGRAADPEFAHHIIEPLKMQGVEQFGDFAIQIRMKMVTKPGGQFVIHRRTFALIKKEFDANGIKFAFPTVQVAGGDEPAAAAAQQALAQTQAAPAPG
jgi:small-conductance mechanosensitive channel